MHELTLPVPPLIFDFMNAVIAAPVDWIEAVGNLRLPPKADQRLQDLMDRNTDGLLSDAERGTTGSFGRIERATFFGTS